MNTSKLSENMSLLLKGLVRSSGDIPKGNYFSTFQIDHPKHWVGIPSSVQSAYEEVFDIIEQSEIGQKITPREIYETFGAGIHSWSQDNLTGPQAVHEFLGRLNSLVDTYTVLLPIWGLIVEKDPICIGNITFLSPDDALCEKMSNPDTQGYKMIFQHSPEFEIVQDQKTHTIFVKTGHAFAMTSVESSKSRMQQMAFEKVEEALGALRIFLRFHPTKSAYRSAMMFGVIGTISSSPLQNISVKGICDNNLFLSKDGKYHFNIQRQAVAPYNLNNDVISEYNKHGFEKLSNCLAQKTGLTQLDQRLNSSIIWLKRAYESSLPFERLLYSAIALEALLCPSSEEKIASTIAESCAIILERGVNNRKTLKRVVKKLYSKRSGIVHKGSRDVTASEADDFLEQAEKIFMATLHRESFINSANELENWLDEQKFS